MMVSLNSKGLVVFFVVISFCTVIRSQQDQAGMPNNGPPPVMPLKRGDKLRINDDIKENDANENKAAPAWNVDTHQQPLPAAPASNVDNQHQEHQQPNAPPPPNVDDQHHQEQHPQLNAAPPAPSNVNDHQQPVPQVHAEAGNVGGQPGRQGNRLQPPGAPSGNGDNLADRSECAIEIQKHCSNIPRHNDIQILQCLQDLDERDESLSEMCQHMLWEFKVNLTEDERFRKAAEQFCKEELERSECGKVTAERGHMISCLSDAKDNMPDGHCKSYLTRIEAVVFTDFRLVGPFVTACREQVRKLNCGQLDDERNKPQPTPQPAGPSGQMIPPPKIVHSQGATLDCLIRKMIESGKGDHGLDAQCRQEIIRIAELQADDFHLDRPLFFACREDREKYCAGVTAGEGRVFQCLAEHRYDNEMTPECKGSLDVRLQLMGRDYKLSKQLVKGCKTEMKNFNCEFNPSDPKLPPPPEHLYLSYLILCLEDARTNANASGHFGMECQTQLYEHRRLLLNDYRMDADVVLACSEDIAGSCGDKLEDGGRTLHCLMGRVRSRDRNMNAACKQAITKLMQGADVGSDYRVDRVLYLDCRRLIDSVCEKQTVSHADTLSCLMTNLESPMMTEECENRLLEVQYFVARDFKLDPQLYQACKDDAASKCSDNGRWAEKGVMPPPPVQHQEQQQQQQQQQGDKGDKQQQDHSEQEVDRGALVVTCLYRHIYSENEDDKPSQRCTKEVERVMHERAVSVNLLPHVENPCMNDLAAKCSQKTGPGEEMRCLQDNLKDLEKPCREKVEEFTEQEGMDARLNHALIRACSPVLEQYCRDTLDKLVDKGDIMECLVKHKGVPAMNSKCRVFINHYELVSLKDYKFTYKFRQACKADIEQRCLPNNGAQDKAAIVGCLSEIVVKHAVLGEKEQLAKECRKQLRAEYFALEAVDVKLFDPKIVDACNSDMKKFCQHAENAGAAIECLRENKRELEPRCRKYVFKKERLEFTDNSFDKTLNRVCAEEIRTLCANENPERVLHCLKTKINREGVQKTPECMQLIKRRKVEQANDYRLQPMLARACDKEIRMVCKNQLDIIKDKPDEEAQGIVVKCLRKHVTTHQRGAHVSPGCQIEVRRIIYESEVDVNLDPPFYSSCKDEIIQKCNQQLMAMQGHENILECMKINYKKGVVSKRACKEELARKISEELADIHLDPELNTACAADLQRYCDGVQAGDGQLLKCLLEASRSGNVRLTQQCHAKLVDREQLWRHIKNDNLPIDLPSDVGAVVQALYASPVRNTLATVLLVIVLIIFAMGLCCGRVTRRVRREMKNR